MPVESIDALLAEVEEQPHSLAAFAGSRFPKASKGAIFAGAGDSYAAALAGFYASRGRCIALDPYTLASEPEVASGLEVYFISVSGRTASNVAAARRVKGIARRTAALTAVEASPLAKSVDRILTLPMDYSPRTVGVSSFSLSLLAVLRLAGWEGTPDFRRALRAAKRDGARVKMGRSTTYFLGNSAAHAAALYAAAKTYEILGAKAQAELLEEFSHLQIFSLTEEDSVNAFACFDPSRQAERLVTALGGGGFSSSLVPARGSTEAERLFHSVFVGQVSVLGAAVEAGVREPRFLSAGKRLQASDSMIY
jgi:fructoselysine-6-P-deglycase FrlB-like protein